MNNPMQLIQMITKSNNPQMLMQSMLSKNPTFQRAMQMAQGKNPEELQQIAKNLCQQRGIDFNQAINQLESMGIKIPK